MDLKQELRVLVLGGFIGGQAVELVFDGITYHDTFAVLIGIVVSAIILITSECTINKVTNKYEIVKKEGK